MARRGGEAAARDGAPERMQCNEVWGGNAAIDTALAMTGLDAWVYSRPYRGESAGGDVHYVSSCPTGRIARLLVADVAGHGEQVAAVASSLRRLMRRFANYIDQTRLVEGLNAEFSKLAELGTFATAVVATYWIPTDDLVLTNAGHPRPLVYRAREGRWSALESGGGGAEREGGARPREGQARAGVSNIPLGIAESAYEHVIARLEPGDLVLIYTDSLVEARGADGRLLGEAGLLGVLAGLDAGRPAGLIPALLRAVEARAAGGMADDVTALLIRPTGRRVRGSARLAARAVWLHLKAMARRLRGEPIPWPELTHPNIGGAMLDRLNRRTPGLRARGPG